MSDAPHVPPPPPAGASKRQLLAPGFLAVLLVVGVGAVIFLAQRSGDTGAPPQPAPFATPEPDEPMIVLSVQQVADGTPVFGDGSGTVDLDLPGGIDVDLLRSASFDDVEPGDWIVAHGVRNEVRNFVIRGFVVFPGPYDEVPGEPVRSPSGFRGHEAASDRNSEPVLSGVVTGVDSDRITFDTGYTETEVSEAEYSPVPLRILEEGSLGDLASGTRVAIAAENGELPADPQGILAELP